MINFVRQNVFSFNSMVTVAYQLEAFPADEPTYQAELGGERYLVRRLTRIDKDYEKKIETALKRVDFKPPFGPEDALSRLERGYYFVTLESEGQMIGWSWAAINKVFYADFNCLIELKEREAFSYNTYVCKEFRGRRLNHLIIKEMVHQLRKDGYTRIWGLILPGNTASRKSFKEIGWAEIGDYKLLRLFSMTFKFPPKEIRRSPYDCL